MFSVCVCLQSILIRWTKGFKCSGVEGEDVVQLLKEAVHRRGVDLSASPTCCSWLVA